jgi:hypothetical protein
VVGQRKTFGCREVLRCQEGLSDVGKLDMKKGFLMQGKFEMQRRLSDAGKLDMKKGFLMQGDFEMPRRAFGCRERGLS